MHTLHKILVYIPDLEDIDDSDRDELIYSIRSYAEDITEKYYGQAYDWRVTETAGDWQNDYPENVLLASEDAERIIEELEMCRTAQKYAIDSDMRCIGETAGTDLASIVHNIWELKNNSDVVNGCSEDTSYHLNKLSAALYGVYDENSNFYNAHEQTARLYPNDMEAIRENPDEWALVMFDYHN